MPTLEKRRHFIFDCAGRRAYRAATLPRSVSDGGMTTFIGTGRGAECQSASRSTATALMVSRWVLMRVGERGQRGVVEADDGNILRDAQPMLLEGADRADCHFLVGCQQRGRQAGTRLDAGAEQAAGGFGSHAGVEQQAGREQAFFRHVPDKVLLAGFGRGALFLVELVVRPQETDPRMPAGQQVIDGLLDAQLEVEHNRIVMQFVRSGVKKDDVVRYFGQIRNLRLGEYPDGKDAVDAAGRREAENL